MSIKATYAQFLIRNGVKPDTAAAVASSLAPKLNGRSILSLAEAALTGAFIKRPDANIANEQAIADRVSQTLNSSGNSAAPASNRGTAVWGKLKESYQTQAVPKLQEKSFKGTVYPKVEINRAIIGLAGFLAAGGQAPNAKEGEFIDVLSEDWGSTPRRS